MPRALGNDMRTRSSSGNSVTCRRNLEYEAESVEDMPPEIEAIPDSSLNNSNQVMMRNNARENRTGPRPRPLSAGRVRPSRGDDAPKRRTMFELSTTKTLDLEHSPGTKYEVTPIRSANSTSPEMIIEVRPRVSTDRKTSPSTLQQPPPYRPPPSAHESKTSSKSVSTGKTLQTSVISQGTRFTVVGRRTPERTPERNDQGSGTPSTGTPTTTRKHPSVWYDYGSV